VVAIVALTPRNEMVLVRQYRHPVGRTLLEIPAGMVEPREALLAAAKREFLEETGFTAPSWRSLGAWFPSPAHTSVEKHVFLARGARRVRDQSLDPTEFLRVEVIPLSALWRRFERTPGHFAEGLLTGIALARRWSRIRRRKSG
jgi:ADP-ribose pyrophosphatase